MKLYLLGDWAQAQNFITGLKVQEALINWLFVQNRWILGIAFAVVFSFAIYTFLKEKKASAFGVALIFTLYVGIISNLVPVTMQTPAMSSSMESSISQAELRVSQAQASLTSAQNQPGQPNVMSTRDRLSYAQSDLNKLKKLDVGVGSEVAKANVLFAFYYNFVAMVFLNAWEVFDSIDQTISVKQRETQSAIASFMANDPALTPPEKAMINEYSKCLIKKQTYIDQVQKIGQNVSRGIQVNDAQDPPLKGKELADAWAKIIYPSKEAMDAVCQTVTNEFGKIVDSSITQAEIDDFKGGFTVFGHTIGEEDQGKYLAATLGVPAEKLVGMTDDDIAKSFYRAKKMEAMGTALRDKMGDISGSSAGAGLLEKSGVKAAVGGWFTNWVGGFALAAKPFIISTINFGFYLLPISFFFVILASFIPKYHWKAHKNFILAFIFMFAWQFSVLVIEKKMTAVEQADIGVMSENAGGSSYMTNLITGSWDQLTGSSSVVDAGAAGALTGKAAMTKAGQAAISKMLFLAKTNPASAAISTIGSASYAVGSAGYNAYVKMDKDNAEFNKLLMQEGQIDPGFAEIANGVLTNQRAQVEAARSSVKTTEAMLILGSTVVALFLVFGQGFGLGGLASMAGQAASSVAGSVSAVATQGLGRGGFKK